MLTLVVTDPDGAKQTLSFDKIEVNIGSCAENDLVLPGEDVSPLHARLLVSQGRLIVIDLGSAGGTSVDGSRLTGPVVLEGEEHVTVGGYLIQVQVTGEVGQRAQAAGWGSLGIISVLQNAAVDKLFRNALLDDRENAIEVWGYELSSSELAILHSATDDQLEAAIRHIRPMQRSNPAQRTDLPLVRGIRPD